MKEMRYKKTHIFIGLPCLLALSLFLFSAQVVGAEEKAYDENLVSAAFIYNFVKFTEWPDETFNSEFAPISLCVLGTNTLGDALATIEGKPIKGNRLTIKRVSMSHDFDECHVVYIMESEKKNLSHIFGKIGHKPVLSVSDMDGFTLQGGIISLIKENNTIRFEINIEAVKRSGLRMDSKLLNLARILKDRHQKEQR